MRILGRSPEGHLKRVLMWMITGAVVLGGYGLAKLEPFFEPVQLTLTELDRSVPFLPWTVWLYGTVTWASLLAWLQVPNGRWAARLFLSMSVAAAACWCFFLLYPTTFPRELYPLASLDTATLRELADLRAADSPTNCFPSMHVALAWSLALVWSGFLERRWAKPLPLLWAAVVSACTLTTKQHYFIDVPAGLIVGVLAWWGVARSLAWWHARGIAGGLDSRPLTIFGEERAAAVAKLRQKVEGHQWSLDTLDWPEGPLPPLDPNMVRLINEVIYIEETAGLNFAILRDASSDEDLVALYDFFAAEERRHADGLRRILQLHEAPIRSPGLGNAMILDQFDGLDPSSPADVALVAVANPVFETFLDAGTIPFLRSHPALQGPCFDEFVRRVCRDEAAHLALNWIVTRQMGERWSGLRGLQLLLNPSIYRGMLAVPFMSLDVYALAARLGYDFRTLLPPFRRLWSQHRRYPELARFPLWWFFRLFVVCGVLATLFADSLHRSGLLMLRFWTTFTRGTEALARMLFGSELLSKRDLPSLQRAAGLGLPRRSP